MPIIFPTLFAQQRVDKRSGVGVSPISAIQQVMLEGLDLGGMIEGKRECFLPLPASPEIRGGVFKFLSLE
jgi:hypothetical protein